jgi:hypothetical protein
MPRSRISARHVHGKSKEGEDMTEHVWILDGRFLAVVDVVADGYVVDFTVYQAMGWSPFGDNSENLFLRKDWTTSGDDTTNVDEAEPFITIGVKWDGCSNWNVGDGHCCDRSGLADIGLVLTVCWDMAGRYMPKTRLRDITEWNEAKP